MFNKLKSFKPLNIDFAILIIRVGFGALMAIDHGWGKLNSFIEKPNDFDSVLGMSPALSFGLAVFAEFFCSIFLAVGFYTRFVLIPLIITMAVAVFQVMAAEPFKEKEVGLLYLLVYVTLFFTGPGKYSVDGKINK